MSVIKKNKHVSKKNKKAWRKYCDITDVEEFLEDQRLEERLGKFQEKSDSELFVVDTEGEIKSKKDVKLISAKQQKRAKLPAIPKCYEILLPSSKVPDPNAKRNHVNPIGSKSTALSKLTEKRRFQKGVYQKKIELARKNRKLALIKKKKNKHVKENFNLDLWGKDLPEAKGIPATLCDEFVPPEAQLHNVLPQQRLRPKPPPPKIVATRKAVETPHPGVSYNPSYQEHQELLKDVVEYEKKLMRKEAHLHRVTTGMFSRITQQEKENLWKEEMTVGLPQPHDPSTDPPESDAEGEYKAINPPVKNKKKDHKARRKQKERLAERERLKREKIDKRKITDIYKLRKLELAIKLKEKRDTVARGKRAEKRVVEEEKALPRINAHKTPAKEPEFVSPDQLSGDLRTINAATNLLRDRFESLQRRGALAASKLMMKKKRKLKSYFKAGHKVTEQDIQRYVQQNVDAKKKKRNVLKG